MKAQIAAEFTMFVALAMVLVLSILALTGSFYADKKNENHPF